MFRYLLGRRARQILARDLMHAPVGPLLLSDDLATAARLLAGRQTDAVIVVGEGTHPRVLGIFSRRDLIVAYGKRMDRIRADTGKEIRLGM